MDRKNWFFIMLLSFMIAFSIQTPSQGLVMAESLISEVDRDSGQEDESTIGEVEDLDEIREDLLQETPITQEQLLQIEDQMIERILEDQPQVSIEQLFDRLIKDYPGFFVTEASRIRKLLVDQFDLQRHLLDQMSDQELLWQSFKVYQANNQHENIGELAEIIRHANKRLTDASGVSQSDRDLSQVKQLREDLRHDTPISDQSLAKINDQQLLQVVDSQNIKMDSLNSDQLELLSRQLVMCFPQAFNQEEIHAVADYIRSQTIDSSAMTQAIAREIPDLKFLAWGEQAVYRQGDPINYPFLRAFTEYTDLFEGLVQEAQANYLQSKLLTQLDIQQISDIELVDALYKADGAVDVAVSQLRQRYPNLLAPHRKNQKETNPVKSRSQEFSSSIHQSEPSSFWLWPLALVALILAIVYVMDRVQS
ncbi:hypothetical protein [Hutsoniella sourekii]|uniref:hypothetical protein n=1 Tax=Hutsoniella sourekii TaxID=87650 RepID=UPI000489CF26|nr:hypothetical protein [Hutsoniella sourekii]